MVCSVDKDLAQLVDGERIVLRDRMRRITYDEAGVVEKFGVSPASIPDYLALVGDSSDGYPGLPGWGAKSAGAVLAKFRHLEGIPASVLDWQLDIRNASRLSATLGNTATRCSCTARWRGSTAIRRSRRRRRPSTTWSGMASRERFLALCEEPVSTPSASASTAGPPETTVLRWGADRARVPVR